MLYWALSPEKFYCRAFLSIDKTFFLVVLFRALKQLPIGRLAESWERQSAGSMDSQKRKWRQQSDRKKKGGQGGGGEEERDPNPPNLLFALCLLSLSLNRTLPNPLKSLDDG
jgi:hypothetical protein